jgi:hypothetical protein
MEITTVNYVVVNTTSTIDQINAYLWSNCRILVWATVPTSERATAIIEVAEDAGWTAEALCDRLLSGMHGAGVHHTRGSAVDQWSTLATHNVHNA